MGLSEKSAWGQKLWTLEPPASEGVYVIPRAKPEEYTLHMRMYAYAIHHLHSLVGNTSGTLLLAILSIIRIHSETLGLTSV